MDCTELMVRHDMAMLRLSNTIILINLALRNLVPAQQITQALTAPAISIKPSRDNDKAAGMDKTTQGGGLEKGETPQGGGGGVSHSKPRIIY